MKIAILGAGLSGISLAYFLQEKSDKFDLTIFEKEKQPGGLCRSFQFDKIKYDIGPHIIFSKDQEVLEFIKKILGENVCRLRRSNRILYKKRFIQYPFENDLSKLPRSEKEKCINSFLNNAYDEYKTSNMLQFFLKTFGEGITNTYLRPYNEKIWKFDPTFMDKEMVERIPKPPKEDIIKSANGETVDGYLHQLYFYYPVQGGIQSIIDSLLLKLKGNVSIKNSTFISQIFKKNSKFIIRSSEKEYEFDKIISTIPIPSLTKIYPQANPIKNEVERLKYNSLIIAIVNVKCDKAKDNYAFMIPDKNVIFHRISKLDFMGSNYHIVGSTTYMIEITFRKNDCIDKMGEDVINKKIITGLKKIGFIDCAQDVNKIVQKKFEYAYVIYDLDHREKVNKIRKFFNQEGILLNGRFGTFEYLNMDAVIRNSMNLANSIE